MFTELRFELGRLRGRILGWAIGLAVYALMMVLLYPNVVAMDFAAYLEAFPQEMLAFFPGIMQIGTPVGYLDTYYYSYMTVIAGILAVGVGAGLLVRQEEYGILDLILAHPVSRTALFWGRYLAMLLCLAIVLLAGQVAWMIPPQSADLGLSWQEFTRPAVPLLAELALFGSLALLLSMLLPSARMAGGLTGALLVANFLLVGMANLNADLERIVAYTPLHFYQGGFAVEGINWDWLGGLVAAALVMAIIAWLLFLRRDIRVGGEHEWRLLPRPRRSAQQP
jgi:ABC-2 type transport system permease protein